MFILRAIREGRCRERRYADHIVIQISVIQNAPFVVTFSRKLTKILQKLLLVRSVTTTTGLTNNYTPETDGERIVKIAQHLTKLRVTVDLHCQRFDSAGNDVFCITTLAYRRLTQARTKPPFARTHLQFISHCVDYMLITTQIYTAGPPTGFIEIQWLRSILSSRVVSASDCGVRFESHRDSRCNIQPWARAVHLYCSA